MDTFDYQRSSVPARMPSQRSASSAMQRYEAESHEHAPSPISIRAVLRASRRYWWLILALWTVGSAGIGAAVYLKVRPMYRASSWLKVDPTVIDLYGMGRGGDEPYMATHVALIKSASVLSAAAADPRAAALPRIQQAGDAIQELSRSIGVGVQGGTHIIEVSMMSESAGEAADLVNSVVDAFLAANRDWSGKSTQVQIEKLSRYKKDLEDSIKAKADELRSKYGKVDKVIPIEPVDPENKAAKAAPGTTNWTVDNYHHMMALCTAAKVELLTKEAELADARNVTEATRREASMLGGDSSKSSAQIEHRLKNDAELMELANQRRTFLQNADKVKLDTRNQRDPAEMRWRDKAAKITQTLKLRQDQKRQQLLEQQSTDPSGATPEVEETRIAGQVKALTTKKAALEEALSKIKLENTKQQSDELDIRFLEEDLSGLKSMYNSVFRKHEQLTFDSVAEERIRRINEARAEGRPISDKRTQYMAMAPIGVLGAVLGLVFLLEIRSGRVSDTEILASRTRQEVFAIAPLPNIRPGIRGETEKAEQRLARFVQSLDHLRVALCEGGTNGEGRCVMITSATGGEGKTTLSAHLAARCANAGTSTLLIDADLRRASLGRLLDVPAGMGLGDVLSGEAELDGNLITVQGGGFHFLSAGSPGIDPTRVLKSTRLAELIGQLRQMYDLIIIDTPPVLPVADALIMGRWADGAVMAARYDASRLPLVERANRQITAAGIPVLGVVVNGMKGQDQAYGSYSYSYNYPGRPDPVDGSVDVAST